ncbi:MAG TPA: hypothetical protein VEZ47_10410 [Gemmatirosa sp.]|nr:hypothetical protein [Gemmatirosa sp.]
MRATEEFQYLAVLLSIILGLGLTQLLTGIGRLIQARARVRGYWPVLAWVALLLLIHVQAWWAMFEMRAHAPWTFLEFGVVLLTPTGLYLMAALVLPDVAEATEEGERLDLRAHYHAQTRWFYGAALLVVLSSLARPLALDGGIRRDADLAFHLVFTALAVVGLSSRRPRWHEVITGLMAALLVSYVLLLFARLR